jgi:hypothetical protein
MIPRGIAEVDAAALWRRPSRMRNPFILMWFVCVLYLFSLPSGVVSNRHHPKPHQGHGLPGGFSTHHQHPASPFPNANIHPHPLFALKMNDTIPSSIISWDMVDTPNRFSLMTVAVQHQHDGNWYIPAVHDKYSIGKWNRPSWIRYTGLFN